MIKRFLALFILLYISYSPLAAQELNGSVKDFAHRPLVSALVYNQSNHQHTHTDLHGNFMLEKVAIGDTIIVSYLAYENYQFLVEDYNQQLDIQLKEAPIAISELLISPELDALEVFTDLDLKTRTVSSSQDVLRQIPGLVIGQHAGGGKAEQIFLRGFDIDHGTDIRISVDGLPVNMVSHAHGQGYADLHFVIPETIENINFDKGTYHADQGNFATAGHITFNTKDAIESNLIKAELGDFGNQRLMTMLSLGNESNRQGYLAAEYLLNDGFFESSQNFDRLNLFGKYSIDLSDSQKINLNASYFSSSWTASGQIPQRAVDAGTICRFGAIDDTEGGNTHRANLSLSHKIELDQHSYIENQLFYSYYDFLLFSNFTFFLNDPINGDQIMQEESRHLFGLNTRYRSIHQVLDGSLDFSVGIQQRADRSFDNRLARTANRTEILENIQFGDITENNLGLYTEASFNKGNWTINAGLRYDHFKFKYLDFLSTTFDEKSQTKAIVSPKLNLLYSPTRNMQYYLKMGRGFHSNDARVVLAQQADQILPAAYSADLGIIAKPNPNLILNLALWNLFLEQEFVYVGDEGIVEPSGRSNRQGIELSGRYQFTDWAYINADLNYTLARSIDEEAGADRIPLAPSFIANTGLQIDFDKSFYGGLQLRHLADRPANEDNSIIALGYTVVDATAGYRKGAFDLSIQIQNIFNTEWNETQFATESRLFNEFESVEEIHFTPGTPFFAKAVFQFSF